MYTLLILLISSRIRGDLRVSMETNLHRYSKVEGIW